MTITSSTLLISLVAFLAVVGMIEGFYMLYRAMNPSERGTRSGPTPSHSPSVPQVVSYAPGVAGRSFM